MDKTFTDLSGCTFGRLTVQYLKQTICDEKYRKNIRIWHCICSCDDKTEIDVREEGLKYGHTKSCGCLRREKVSARRRKHNIFDLESYDYGVCYLDNNKCFKFDKEDYKLISKYFWMENDQQYIIAYDSNRKKNIRLHRLIMNVLDDRRYEVDHVYHDTYDNRKRNLRLAFHSQNLKNLKTSKANSSGVKGIYFDKQLNKWRVQIRCDNKRIHVGVYDDFNKAIEMRKFAEERYFKEWNYKEKEE